MEWGVDGLTLTSGHPGMDLEQFRRNGVVATALRIRDLAEHGELRTEHQVPAELIPLSAGEVTNVALRREREWLPRAAPREAVPVPGRHRRGPR